MNLLDAIPVLSDLVDRFVPEPGEAHRFKSELARLETDRFQSATERFSMVAGPVRLMLYLFAGYMGAAWLLPVFGVAVPPLPEEVLAVVRWTLAFAIPAEAASVNTIEVGPGGRWLRSPAAAGLFTTPKGGTQS